MIMMRQLHPGRDSRRGGSTGKRAPAMLAMVLGLAWGGMSGPSATWAGLRQHVEVRHYVIAGGDELAMLRQMRRKGPRVGGRPALASTRMQASYSARLVRRGGVCRVSRFSLNVRFVIMLPRISGHAGVPRTARRRWPGFVARLKRHEARHMRIWQECLRQVQRDLPALQARDCRSLKSRMRATYGRIMDACSKRHDAFDRREKHAATSLPFIKAAFGLAKGVRQRPGARPYSGRPLRGGK